MFYYIFKEKHLLNKLKFLSQITNVIMSTLKHIISKFPFARRKILMFFIFSLKKLINTFLLYRLLFAFSPFYLTVLFSLPFHCLGFINCLNCFLITVIKYPEFKQGILIHSSRGIHGSKA